jgi:hypothetical protein
VCVKGSLAFLADGPEGFHILDVTESASPKILSTCVLAEGYTTGVAVKDDYAYVSDEILGLIKIDIRDPKKPEIVARFGTPGETTGLVFAGDYILVFDSFSLMIFK